MTGGALEGSNVNMTQALVDMIENQRSYEVQANLMKAAKDMDESARIADAPAELKESRPMTTAAMHIARTGLDAQDMRMRVISNNLANVNTTGLQARPRGVRDAGVPDGHRARRAVDQRDQIRDRAEPRHRRARPGHRADRHAGVDADQTGNSLDLALDGDGYFQVQLPGGKLGYTRAGNFSRSAEGLLVTSEGYQVQPGITVPEGATADHHRHRRHRLGDRAGADRGDAARPDPGRELPQRAPGCSRPATITWSRPPRRGAANLGVAGAGRPRPRSARACSRRRNVNVVEELVDMIETQRAYEVNSKMISATDDMLKYVNQNI